MKYILKEAPIKEYNEIVQSKEIGFSFCNKKRNTIKQIFHWAICRDFLNDVLIAEEQNIKVNIYNFRYDPSKNKIDRDRTRFLLKFYDPKDIEYLLSNLSILNTIEKNNKFYPTILRKIEKDIYLVEGSKLWLNSTFSLHLYTFLLKAMTYEYHDKDNWLEELKQSYTNEGEYANRFIPQFEDIIYISLKKLFTKGISVHGYLKKDWDIAFLHNNSGILTLFRKEASNFINTQNNEYYKRLVKLLTKV